MNFSYNRLDAQVMAGTSLAVDRKRSYFEANTLCVALEGVESLLMEV